MATESNKRTINMLIGAGYCLAALFILFNYHYSSTHPRDEVLVPKAADNLKKPAKSASDADLEKQLNEERKINREMREMLTRLQKAKSPEEDTSLQAAQVFNSVESVIPELNEKLLDEQSKTQANPFIPGKNPFHRTFYVEKKVQNVSRQDASFLPKPDSGLPFILSGSGGKFGYTSNH